MTIKLQTNNLFRTFTSEKELADYIDLHIPEERRLLYMGVMYGCNYTAYQINKTFNLEYKKDKNEHRN